MLNEFLPAVLFLVGALTYLVELLVAVYFILRNSSDPGKGLSLFLDADTAHHILELTLRAG